MNPSSTSAPVGYFIALRFTSLPLPRFWTSSLSSRITLNAADVDADSVEVAADAAVAKDVAAVAVRVVEAAVVAVAPEWPIATPSWKSIIKRNSRRSEALLRPPSLRKIKRSESLLSWISTNPVNRLRASYFQKTTKSKNISPR